MLAIPLVEINLSASTGGMPGDVRTFLREADRRIERFQMESRIPGFVPSDFASAYGILRSLSEGGIARGSQFCEWGSGFGVVTCLAAMLDFEAWGIEIEAELVAAAQQLAEDYDLPAEFIHGSFIPAGSADFIDSGEEYAWLTPRVGDRPGEMERDPDDFDTIFAYPWPDEEELTEKLFERYANDGAILATYHSGESWRVRRLEKRKPPATKRPKRKGR